MKHEQDDACFTEDEKCTGLETPPMLKDVRLTLDPKALEAANPDLDVVKKVAANLASCGSIEICVIDDTDSSDANSNSLDEKGNPCALEAGIVKPPKKKRSRLITDEPWYLTLVQICVPFFIAGLGTIGAGLVLAKVKNWEVFREVSQIFILVPALLGLKGNLDMCLASRLSTQANLGNMKSPREIGKMIIGNLALVQVQATVAATLVAMFATGVSAVMNGEYSWDHFLLVMASSVCTAASSCFILDLAMIIVIMAAYKMKMNPDNLATPLAASIGDVVSLSVLSAVASQLYTYQRSSDVWILYAIIVLFFGLLPIWICIVLKNKYTKPVLTSGWVPVISALFISGLGGLILDKAVNTLNGFDVFAPIINGIGGNLVSVHASRISSMLHQSSVLGSLPGWAKTWVSPWKALFHGQPTAKTARLLLGMAVPGHVAFSFLADYLRWSKSTVHVYFVASYLTVALIQVALLLYVAHVMIHIMWKYKVDPDNSAIPYLTALGDLSGSLLLAAAFKFLSLINQEYYNDCVDNNCGTEDLLANVATTLAPGAF